jgi:type VI secretion system Hcp family effector
MRRFPSKLHVLAPVAAAMVAVAASATAFATPITSVANAPHSAISPGGVDMATGEIIVVCRPDLVLEGPMPVVFGRYYASMLGREGLASGRVGLNWLGTYDWKLNISGSTADVITANGMDVKFQMPPAGGPWQLVSPLDHAYVLSFTGGNYRFTDPRSRRVYLFSGTPPMLTQIIDEHGNSLTLTYSGSALTQVSDGLGRLLTITYDPRAGVLSSITDGTRTVSYSFTGNLLTGVTDAAGQHWSYAYLTPATTPGLLTGAGEPLGNTPLQNGYDASGRVITQTDAAGGSAHYAWDTPAGNVFTDSQGRAWNYQHDAQNRLVSLTDPGAQPWSRAYDARGRLASETRPLGDMTSYSYDATSGYPAAVGFADGSVSHWTYGSHTMGGATFYDLASVQFPDLTSETFTRDAAGNPTLITDRAGGIWQPTFNARGQMLTSTSPPTLPGTPGGVTSYAYDTHGRPTSITDPAGNVTRFTYDGLGRLIAVAPDDTSSRSWTYDALDHVLSAVDERGKTSTFQYDANGRLTGATDPLLATTHYAYDGLDRLMQVTDPLGHATTLGYDGQGQVTSITDGSGLATSYSYGLWGDYTGVTDAASASWTYARDPNRRVTSAQDPLGHSFGFSYDAVDRLRHLQDPTGTGFDYGYDAMDRLRAERGPLGYAHDYSYDARGMLTLTRNAASEYDFARNALGGVSQFTDPNRNASLYSYDSQGRLTMASDPLGRATSYSYDARSRLVHATLTLNGANLMYDGADRLLGVSITDGTSLAYNYDDANRLTGGTGAAFAYDAGGRMISSNGLGIAYDAAGRITSETYSPGHVVNYSYDARGALSQVSDWLGGVTRFNYDLAGNYTGTTRPNGTQGTYAYDAAGRLVNAVEKSPGPGGISALTITRDALEQPTAVERSAPLLPGVQTPGTTNLAYDAASQVAGPAWDPLGRLLGDGSRTLVWDGTSRLTSYSIPGESQSFSHDAFGRLLSRTQGAASEHYAWNYANGSPTLDVVMNGASPVRYFVHTPSGLLLESIEAGTGARHYYHYDENGNTIFLTDDHGAVSVAYAYGPYGDVRSSGLAANNLFTLGGARGVIQLGSSGLYDDCGHGSGGIYDTKYARMVSGGATVSGAGEPMNGGTGGLSSGLMEEEGIFYYFKHVNGKHSLEESLNGGITGNTIPSNGIPGTGVLENGISGNTVLDNRAPNIGIPNNGVPDHGIPNGAALGNIVAPQIIAIDELGKHGFHTEGYNGCGAYMYLDDAFGAGGTESTARPNDKAFEIMNFSFGVTNAVSIGTGTGGAGGKAGFHEFTITKQVDSATPDFFKSCLTGSHYKTVVIQMRKAGGDGSAKTYLQYTFKLVSVTNASWSSGSDGSPSEIISFQFGAVDIQYQSQTGGGSTSNALAPYWRNSNASGASCLWCPR